MNQNHPRYIFLLVLPMVFTISSMGCFREPEYASDTGITWPIPYLEELVADGKSWDWPEDYRPIKILSDVCGNVPDTVDFQASFRLAWNQKGIWLLAEFTDDSLYEDPEQFWRGDGLEIFINQHRGSMKIIQVSVRPGLDLAGPVAPFSAYDHFRSVSIHGADSSALFYARKTNPGYLIEGRIPFEMIGLDPHPDREMAIQLYMNDADREDDPENFSLPWYSVRESYRNPYAYYPLVLTADSFPSASPELRACIIDGNILKLSFVSDRVYDGCQFQLISGSFSFRFSNLPSKHWTLPVDKMGSDGEKFVGLVSGNQYIELLDLGMAHNEFVNTEPGEWYEDDISLFKTFDRYDPPPAEANLFTGSSTIRRWHSLAEDMHPLQVINRGFGGSIMKELNENIDRIVFPYKPSRIFVYEGDNDIARGTPPAAFLEECKTFIRQCHHRLPETQIIFLSIKPSPARMKYWKKMNAANQMLEDLCMKHEKVFFIDISTPMFSNPGILKNDIYADDRLHLNEKGYSLLKQVIKENIYKFSN